MRKTSADGSSRTCSGRPWVLYHAVSSYQLLEVMLHRLLFHPADRAALLLPDFITRKYSQAKGRAIRRFFDEAYLFPYLHIPHREEERVLEDVERSYARLVPRDPADFSAVYVAGAHFYFSLYLIARRIPFVFFEDAAGMLSRSGELHDTLAAKYPVHAAIARRHGLFDGENPLVRAVVCLKRAQTIDVSGERFLDFSVEDALEALPAQTRRQVVRFFLRRRIRKTGQAVLLTQQLANQGVLDEAGQRRAYERLRDGPLRGLSLVIKPHPDDTLSYTDIFPGAAVLRKPFPSELLPYVFRQKPPVLYTLDSTGCENLGRHFIIRKLGRESYV